MRVAEVFESVQGEGQFTGTPSAFVRTTGCNLRCWFCDTRYASWEPEGEQRTWQSVFEQLRDSECEHVVLTGGEPLLQPGVVPLTHALGEEGKFVTIETAATVYRPVHADLMSISPKLANSGPNSGAWSDRHERLRDRPDVVARMIGEFNYQLKFVIDRPEDIAEVETYLTRFDNIPADHVWLMPQATTADELREKTAWLETAARQYGFHFTSRLQIEFFGNVRGT